jgi:3-hydroxyisobutyrate dehydrogenase
MNPQIGFIGLGTMGFPMAKNLLKSGQEIMVWNRTLSKSQELARDGATVAKSVQDVFQACSIVFIMLANGHVMDHVLERSTKHFAPMVKGKTIVQMGTVLPVYSDALRHDVENAGGHYIEAPVSGSRIPAEQRQLVTMIAGEAPLRPKIIRLLGTMTREIIDCGTVPKAMHTKLAVNTYLIGLVTSLVESFHYAIQAGIDLNIWEQVLCSGPMANEVMKIKAKKLISHDFKKQAAIHDVLYNAMLITGSADSIQADTPILDICEKLFHDADHNGHGQDDMAAVLKAYGTASE